MDKASQKLYSILKQHVPANAVHYCLDLWSALPFHFKVTRKRSSKLGDYRFDPNKRSHTITVNVDLNPFNFLITYIHEFAHLLATERYGRSIPPHGKEWKNTFKEIMEPVLTDLIFPKEVLVPLQKHMQSPKASTYADARLIEALRLHDTHDSGLIPLSNLQIGDIFEFNKNMYTKLELKRTRVLCQQTDTSRKYLISKMALVRTLRKQDD